jgi:CRISPR-associated endonuclease Cas1
MSECSQKTENARVLHGWRGTALSVYYGLDGNSPTGFFQPIRRAQVLCFSDPEIRLGFARAFLRGALKSIRDWAHAVRLADNAFFSAFQRAVQALEETRDIEELMGVEGSLRREYYAAWERKLPAPLGFRERNRRPPLDPVNAMLSYGNSILYGLSVPPIGKAGLYPDVGFLHEPGARRYSLALDVSEIFKPLIVDCAIWDLIGKEAFSADWFEKTSLGCFMNKEGRKELRLAMVERAEKVLGKGRDRLGWPESLWDQLQRVSDGIAASVLKGQAPSSFSR